MPNANEADGGATVAVDIARVMHEIDTLAGFSDAPAPAVTRVLYTEADLAARAFLRERALEAGLSWRSDALGNTFVRWEGSESGPAVATGSHIDAIPHAGRYDGVVGVIGGLEAIRALQAAGFQPRRSIELVIFTAEEPTRYGIGCLGSRVMAGTLAPDDVRALVDDTGTNPEDAARSVGFEGALEAARLPTGHFHAFVELHIEQGPILEERGVPIGVVTGIAAPATLHVTLLGEGGHAGAVLMPSRRDALAAAAELVLAVEEAAKDTGAEDSVATVGILDVHPRAVNSIPGRAFLTIDVRDTDGPRRDAMVERVREATHGIAAARSVRADALLVNADPPALCDERVRAAIAAAAEQAGHPTLPLVSRAYHDALFMARICPVGMIFVPCHAGVSHRPDEHAEPEWIAAGIRTLAGTLARLSYAA